MGSIQDDVGQPLVPTENGKGSRLSG